MDDTTLAGLKTAFAATPNNGALLQLLVNELLARKEHAEAWSFCERAPAADPMVLFLRARTLLALERRPEGLAAYKEAVASNPTLEDKELETALGARVHEGVTALPSGQRLRVIANDETAQDDAMRLFEPEQKTMTFKDVGGLDDIKAQIRKRIITPFEKPSLFAKFKKRLGGGILLYGPPGCGKTLLARATAGEVGAKFFNVAISDVLDMYIGESERKLKAIFDKARASKPAVLFFDELEALAGRRQFSREAHSAKMVSQFLAEMDGFSQDNQGVLILGATNAPWAVDAAFRRAGRFDRVQFIPPPDAIARRSILELLLAGRPVADNLDLGAIAAKTSGFTGADLLSLVEEAADAAIERSLSTKAELPIEQSDLVAAVKQTKSTSMEWLTSARNHARYSNESGHYDDVLAFLEKHGKA